MLISTYSSFVTLLQTEKSLPRVNDRNQIDDFSVSVHYRSGSKRTRRKNRKTL